MTNPIRPKKTKTSTLTYVESANAVAKKSDIANQMADMLLSGEDSFQLTGAQLKWALNRLACGDQMVHVTAALGIGRGSLWLRARESEPFRQLLMTAVDIGARALRDNGLNAVMGGVMSTGSVERDRLVWDAIKWIASRESRAVYGDRVQVDQRTVQVNISKDDAEW